MALLPANASARSLLHLKTNLPMLLLVYVLAASVQLPLAHAGENESIDVAPRNLSQVDGNRTLSFLQRRGESERPSSRDAAQRRALVVDVAGPNRMRGDGVRLMGMLRDLQACDYKVEVLAEVKSYEDMRQSWPTRVQNNYLSNVRLWAQDAYTKENLRLESYDRIIIGGKLDLMDPARPRGVVQDVLADIVSKKDQLRSKTAAFWDDVPFVRCEYRGLCDHVAKMVSQFAEASRDFYVLTPEDSKLMKESIKGHGIRNVNVPVWPMRIRGLSELLPSQGFDAQSVISDTMTQLLLTPGHMNIGRKYITMVANNHVVNRQNVGKLFKSGAVARICDAVRLKRSPVKLLFLGGIANEARTLVNATRGSTDCVEVVDKFVQEEDLRSSILPNTRAVLNPFFFDVRSGISVKTYEAIMGGYPFITSKFGLHGLLDIQGCSFQTPQDPENLDDFASFVVQNVVEDSGYRRFIRQFSAASKTCIQRQLEAYPLESICS